MFSVLMADDHKLLIEGLRLTLEEEGIEVVSVAHTLDDAIERYFRLTPDVLVLDVQFGRTWDNRTGLDVCLDILEHDPGAKILIFSQFDNPYIVKEAYANGALAFVRKDESAAVFLDAIRSVAEGTVFYSPKASEMMRPRPRPRPFLADALVPTSSGSAS